MTFYANQMVLNAYLLKWKKTINQSGNNGICIKMQCPYNRVLRHGIFLIWQSGGYQHKHTYKSSTFLPYYLIDLKMENDADN